MTGRKTCLSVSVQLVRQGVVGPNTLTVGRLRMVCNLVSQYVTHDLYSALFAKYEYVLFCCDRFPPVPSFDTVHSQPPVSSSSVTADSATRYAAYR